MNFGKENSTVSRNMDIDSRISITLQDMEILLDCAE